MEYPGIVFVSPSIDAVAHEVAHQWWYGSVGNDEYGAPWLDESFATWSQTLPFDPWTRCERYDWPSSDARVSSGVDYFRRHPYQYGVVYAGGGCMLANLAGRFGLDRFETILRTYALDHRNGITDGASFRAAIERAARRYLPGFDARTFWRRWRAT
jgi:aminopeptidase N